LAFAIVELLQASRLLFFVYAAISLALLDALDYSRIDMTVCVRNGDRYLKNLLAPFSLIEKGVRKIVRGSRARLALSGGYFAYDLIALIAVPFMVAWLSAGFYSVEDLILAIGIFWVALREECGRGLKRSRNGV
jgi:hypothetical protein